MKTYQKKRVFAGDREAIVINENHDTGDEDDGTHRLKRRVDPVLPHMLAVGGLELAPSW